MSFDVAIIGAGIVGAACAFRLSLEGFKVVVIEAGDVAGGTTAAGMGHIVVMDDSEAQFALTKLSRDLWRKLAADLPSSSEFQNSGTIWVAADEIEMEEVRRKNVFFRSRGVNCEILDEKSLVEAEPNLRNGLAGGLRIPDDCVVYQLCAAKYFIEAAESLGAKTFLGKRVVEISDSDVKLENGDSIRCRNVINAAGTGSAALFGMLKIVRKKGHLVITDRYPGFVKHQLIELGYLKSAHSENRDSVAFNVQPRATEQLLIGSSRQFGSEDRSVDHNIVRQMIERAKTFMPGLKDLSATRIWTGFRPSSPDNLPYIGKYPGFENVYLAAGHEGLGITTSLGTAELLADEILGRDSVIDRKPYSPGRLSILPDADD